MHLKLRYYFQMWNIYTFMLIHFKEIFLRRALFFLLHPKFALLCELCYTVRQFHYQEYDYGRVTCKNSLFQRDIRVEVSPCNPVLQSILGNSEWQWKLTHICWNYVLRMPTDIIQTVNFLHSKKCVIAYSREHVTEPQKSFFCKKAAKVITAFW